MDNRDDLILAQLQALREDFRNTRKELSERMDRLETHAENSRKELSERMSRLEKRQDKLEEQIGKTNERIDKLIDKVDGLNEKLDGKIETLRRDTTNSTRHGQLADISTIGIAVAVIYSLLAH